MNMHLRYVLALCAVMISACGADDTEDQSAPAAAVTVVPAVRHSIEESISSYGTAEFSPGHSDSLTTQVEARVSDVLVSVGSTVKRGQPLLRLEASAATRLELAKARVDAQSAEAEAERVGRLRGLQLATEAELKSADAAASTARELHASLEARIGGGVTLTAPRNGVVDALAGQIGELLAPGAVVIRVADPDALQIRLGLEPEDAARVRVGQPAVITALMPQSPDLSGHVASVDPRVDPQSRLAAALIELSGTSGLAPGSTVRGRIVVQNHPKAITVPRSAVLFGQDGQAYVFVVRDGKVARVDVRTGLQDETQIEILAGISEGEAIVSSGNYELADGMPVQVAGTTPADEAQKSQ